ncbi:MAG: deoxyribonuclease IV, partial [Phycisphaerales bacterium]|nr:deoxyribonuclease IV [Phycisphaerales bacterium]
MFGSHLSIAGSMCNALGEAQSLQLDCLQVFTKNQQQWKVRPLKREEVDAWAAALSRMDWAMADGRPPRTVSHASYLINLAAPDDELWGKSIDLMTEEVERCEALGIPLLVHHPGAFTTSSREAGLARIARAYREVFKRTKGYRTVSCLENTVGSGSNLGREFEELGALRAMIAEATGVADRVGFCFDTCHA